MHREVILAEILQRIQTALFPLPVYRSRIDMLSKRETNTAILMAGLEQMDNSRFNFVEHLLDVEVILVVRASDLNAPADLEAMDLVKKFHPLLMELNPKSGKSDLRGLCGGIFFHSLSAPQFEEGDMTLCSLTVGYQIKFATSPINLEKPLY